jgi:hypothetical protein
VQLAKRWSIDSPPCETCPTGIVVRTTNIRNESRAVVAGSLMAQPVYPSSGNTPCVPAPTLRANERTRSRGRALRRGRAYCIYRSNDLNERR